MSATRHVQVAWETPCSLNEVLMIVAQSATFRGVSIEPFILPRLTPYLQYFNAGTSRLGIPVVISLM